MGNWQASFGALAFGVLLCGCHASADCEDGDRSYGEGQAWTCSDGCNMCGCHDGKVSSTLIACLSDPGPAAGKLSCVQGVTHPHGTNWACTDGCGDCHCHDGSITQLDPACGSSRQDGSIDNVITGESDAGAGDAGGRSRSGQDCEAPMFPALATTCHRNADCADGMVCSVEITPPPQCGSPCPGCFTDQCASDADCAGGICERNPLIFDHTECRASCAATGCADGDRCGTDGRCEPIECEDGFACPARSRCNATSMNADAHGCEPLRCDEPDGTLCEYPWVCATGDSVTTPVGCAIIACDDARHPGCEPNMQCTPELAVPNSIDGCGRIACTRDADCDCGSCLLVHGASEGLCFSHVGVCEAALQGNCPP